MEFYEFLTANGVVIPTEPANPNFIQEFFYIRKRKKFEETWHYARECFETTFQEDLKFLKRLWNAYESSLQKNWSVGLPPLPEVLIGRKFCSPHDAILAMQKFVDTTPWFNKNNELIEASRNAWINQLVAAAPEGCKLVVVRTGYKPHSENQEHFNKFIEEGKQCSITDCFVGMWVAFPPENPDAALERNFWGCTKGNSTVEYVV